MGLINSTVTEQSGDLSGKDSQPKPDSGTETKRCAIINNAHSVTHKDCFFGARPLQKPLQGPERLTELVMSSSSTRTPMRSSRRQRKQTVIAPPLPQWVSRMYIDPPVVPKVPSRSKMEVKLMIDQGRVKDIENACAVPSDVPLPVRAQQKRAVSYLHLSVSQNQGDFEIRPLDKGDFTLPQLGRLAPDSPPLDLSQHQVLCTMLSQPSIAWAVTRFISFMFHNCVMWFR